MPAKAQTLRVGLFAAVALALFAIVLIVFGGLRFWVQPDRYRIVFEGSVIGLDPGAQVYLNGIKVGAVGQLEVAAADIRKVAVEVELEPGTPVHADTRAVLQYAGITGLKVIDLRGGSSASPRLPPGGEIAAGVGVLDKLETQVERIADQSTALIQRANVLTDHLIAITEPAKRAANNLATLSASLDAMVEENRVALRQSLAAFQRASNQASKLLDGQAVQLLTDASGVVTDVRGVVTDVRRMLTVNEAPLRAAVFDFRQASRSFKELVRDVRQRPSRLLFSGAPDERKLP